MKSCIKRAINLSVVKPEPELFGLSGTGIVP
jgi:hypothetical protein